MCFAMTNYEQTSKNEKCRLDYNEIPVLNESIFDVHFCYQNYMKEVSDALSSVSESAAGQYIIGFFTDMGSAIVQEL